MINTHVKIPGEGPRGDGGKDSPTSIQFVKQFSVHEIPHRSLSLGHSVYVGLTN